MKQLIVDSQNNFEKAIRNFYSWNDEIVSLDVAEKLGLSKGSDWIYLHQDASQCLNSMKVKGYLEPQKNGQNIKRVNGRIIWKMTSKFCNDYPLNKNKFEENNIYYELKSNTQYFLHSMFFICNELEQLNNVKIEKEEKRKGGKNGSTTE